MRTERHTVCFRIFNLFQNQLIERTRLEWGVEDSEALEIEPLSKFTELVRGSSEACGAEVSLSSPGSWAGWGYSRGLHTWDPTMVAFLSPHF